MVYISEMAKNKGDYQLEIRYEKKNKFEKKDFPGRELNPGLPGERQTS